ncbi:MAG TPA: heme ABC exporter ATP-binding protein CcmA [Brevundimonas sp.]|uniref:heme ABC exporter ATP-binding protein CcmA n=1 Tax=Brevundimonas sp. TaxID=1871086 RepID=UPI002DE6A60E|nr:heme ABC exporter ATP-binding protein CcmA [Brevundimonas sp.]
MIAALTVFDLSVSRGERRLFDGLSFALRAGEAAQLTGANGAGKTSLLRAVAGLLRPDGGEVRFEGAGGPLDAGTARAAGVQLLAHQEGFRPGRTARAELTFQARWFGASAEAVAAAAKRLDLTPLLDLEVRVLSAGQKRRLALASLVAAERPMWLLDEPLAPLDARRRAQAAEIMAEHLNRGGMILAAVHDPLPVAAREIVVGAPA